MGQKRTRDLPARQAEKRLVKMAAEAARKDCPNPERIGCPSSDAVDAIVGRRLSFPDFDNVIDHIATCGPCLEEYNRQRRRYRLRNIGTVALACAGLLILALFWRYSPRLPHPKTPLAKEVSAPVLTAMLDYRSWTAERSGQGPRRSESPHLTRAQLDLTVRLPIGTEDGVYTVQFRSQNGQLVAEAVGSATWDGMAEALRIRTDLHNVPAGAYTVAIRSANSSFRLYPLVLE